MLLPRFSVRSCVVGVMLALTVVSRADFTELWHLGAPTDNPNEFGYEDGQIDAYPTVDSPTTRDDDYYFAGTYASPVGVVATSEPEDHFERALTGDDKYNRIHFTLTAPQVVSTAMLRLQLKLIWGGWDNAAGVEQKDFGDHLISVRINGKQVFRRVVKQESLLVITPSQAAAALVTGENVMEIGRVGGARAGWIFYDWLRCEIDTRALEDADSDGLPRWWELDHGLSDANAGDAALDTDHDGLTNLQELQIGTDPIDPDTDHDGLKDGDETNSDPLVADTDGDGLLDGAEMTMVPPLNPNSVDSDDDGAPDGWEVRTGFLPSNASSVAPSFGVGIGVKFISELSPESTIAPIETTGFVPQMSWNNTIALSSWDSNALAGTVANIASPVPGKLVNSAGAPTSMGVSWTASRTDASGNAGGVNQRLLNTGLEVDDDTTPVSVTLSKVPYPSYDVIVYVGSRNDGSHGYLRLNGSAASDRHFVSGSAAPEVDLIEPRVQNNPSRPWRGNVIRFRNVSGASVNVKLYRLGYDSLMLHAIQVVSSSQDTDKDKMPDWWEVMNKTNVAVNDASADLDGDGLSNFGEFQRGTRADVKDSDGDGLSDFVETNTRTFVSASNTGSDPLNADTDGDTLSDGDEMAMQPQATNPNKADSDGDGRSDLAEIDEGTNPAVANASKFGLPTVTGGAPKSFLWDVTFQLVWDHSRGRMTEGQSNDSWAMNMRVGNKKVGANSWALVSGLRTQDGRLTWLFHSNHEGALSDGGNPAGDIWNSDWNDPPADLTPALGFSGHGKRDISARLRSRVSAISANGSAGGYALSYTLTNLDTNQVVASYTDTNCTLAPSVHNNTVTWTNTDGVDNRLYLDTGYGLTAYLHASSTSPSIETLPAFANDRDSDNDGMPDVWETTYSFNKLNAADAALDFDGDSLSNLREYELSTDPKVADTDGDGVNDGLEVAGLSDPLKNDSVPPGYNGTPASTSPERSILAVGTISAQSFNPAFAAAYGLGSSNAFGDSDHDGQLNWQEAVAGTNPLDPRSRLWADVRTEGSDLVVTWPRILNKSHKLQGTADFVSWMTLNLVPQPVGALYKVVIANGASSAMRFFRVAVDDVDSDRDGVNDWTEVNLTHTSPIEADSSHAAVTQLSGGVPTQVSGDYVTMLETFGKTTSAPSTSSATIKASSIGTASPQNATIASNGITRSQAARFLMQASFGPTLADIDRVQLLGYEAWIDEQFALAPTLHSTYVNQIFNDYHGAHVGKFYDANDDGSEIKGTNLNTAFARAAVAGKDQLRQRVAFALSQIMVISRRDDDFRNKLRGVANYYDIFVNGAFGRYEDMLTKVSLHPCMGDYLSSVGNQKADPSINRYPDENYAREIMQLFTIGLWKLNPDGTRQQDGFNHDIPTYSNTEITSLARVFTGLWYGNRAWGDGGYAENDYIPSMSMHADRHDFEAKTLQGGYVIPARTPSDAEGLRDVTDAVRYFARHSNVAPFIGRQLIQFLVTDNPSAAYIGRVSAAWANNGSGVSGDMKAVLKAVLLDAEARDPVQTTDYGRLKEPTIRAMAMARAFNMQGEPNFQWWGESEFYEETLHEPTYSPSVFNFYRPDYQAPGVIATADKKSPVFQITNSYTAIASPNMFWELIEDGFQRYNAYDFHMDLSRETTLAADNTKLLDYLNLIFCAGAMSTNSRNVILNALDQIPSDRPAWRAQVGAYLALICPEGAVMK